MNGPNGRRPVVVLSGGTSGEREVSLRTGAAVEEALRSRGLEVDGLDTGDGVFQLAERLASSGPVVFNALHGGHGENGSIQGLFEILRVPYTHSGVLASALAMDKPASRRLFEGHGVPVAEGTVVPHSELARGDPLPRPFVVKPPAGGSSIGVTVVREGAEPPPPPAEDDEHPVLVEAYVPGREITVAVLGGEALAPLEIRPRSGFYDYDSKYRPGESEYFVPAPIPEEASGEARDIACRAHELLGCRGLTRHDFRYDDSGEPGRLVLLEVNTQPGLTPTSLVPRIAEHAGISFEDLCVWMLEDASCER